VFPNVLCFQIRRYRNRIQSYFIVKLNDTLTLMVIRGRIKLKQTKLTYVLLKFPIQQNKAQYQAESSTDTLFFRQELESKDSFPSRFAVRLKVEFCPEQWNASYGYDISLAKCLIIRVILSCFRTKITEVKIDNCSEDDSSCTSRWQVSMVIRSRDQAT